MPVNIPNAVNALRDMNSRVCRLLAIAESYQDGKHKTGGKEFTMSAADKTSLLDEYHTLDAELSAAIATYNTNKP